MTGQKRVGRFEPVTPSVDGQPPQFTVSCLDCPGFKKNVHATSGDLAAKAVTHQTGHRLVPASVDFSSHPRYGGSR